MPSFGLPSMDESVNDHSKIEKAEESKDGVAASPEENGEVSQTADQPKLEPSSEGSNDHVTPLPDENCTPPDQLSDQDLAAAMVLYQLQLELSSELAQTSSDATSEIVGQSEQELLSELLPPAPDGQCGAPEIVDGTFADRMDQELSRELAMLLAGGQWAATELIDGAVTDHPNDELTSDGTLSHESHAVPQESVNDDSEEVYNGNSLVTHTDASEIAAEPDTAPKEVDVSSPIEDESVACNLADQPTDAVESTGSEPVPLVLDDTGSLIEEYGSPMVMDEQDGPNLYPTIDQPPLPQPNLFEATTTTPSIGENLMLESPAVISEQESFVSAISNLMPDFNISVEPMEIDSISDATATILEAQSDTSGVGLAEDEVGSEFIDEVVPQPQTDMSAEESENVVAPVSAATPATIGNSIEEKPLAGRQACNIDWDNFDENSVPNPFGTRMNIDGKSKAPSKRPIKKQPKAEEKKTEPTEAGGGAPPSSAPAADNNANELKPVESSPNTQEGQAPRAAKTEEDLKNSNVIHGEATNSDAQPTSKNKENVSARNTPTKAPRPSPQQTAVVAPTVHVAAAVGSGNEVDNANAASRNPLRRPPIKTNASVNATVQQTVPMPAQNNRHSSPKGARSGDESISEEEMFVMASSDPFNDSAAFEYLQQAGGAARSSAESNLHRQSLYQKFDPLVGGEGAVASGSETKQRRQQPPSATGITDEVISVGDVTFTEKDELLLINTPSPIRDQSRSDDSSAAAAPSTVVKKKHGPKVQSGVGDSLAQGDTGEADRLLSLTPDQKSHSAASSASGQEVKLQFQALLMAKEKEFQLRLEEEKLKRMQLDMELAAVKKEAEAAKQNSAEMSFVVAEYEKTVRQLIAEKDKPKQNRSSGEFELVQKELEQTSEALQTVENAFSELNRRYETLRNGAAEFKKNEELLKSSLVDYQHKLKKSEEKFNKLYAHAEHKLELANQEIERLQKAKETDTLALRAALKKRDLQVETLEKNLEQKQKEIQELTSICDELIQKAGGH